MKAVLLLCVLGIAIAAAGHTHGHNGRPGCILDEELTRPWRNNFDPTRYWVCNKRGEAGVEVKCKSNKGFMNEPFLDCVDWADWYWTEPYDPPTLG